MENVMELARGPHMGEVFARLGGWIHENPESVKRGFETSVPASIAGLVERASTPDGVQTLLSTLRRGDYPHMDTDELERTATDQLTAESVARSGEGFLRRLFGTKESVVVDGVAASSGVSRSSASKLLGLASQLVLGLVGREAVLRNMDASGLRGFLASLRAQAAGAMPGPLANVFGGPAPSQGPAIRPVPRPSTAGTWFLAGLVAIAAIGLLNWRRHSHQRAVRMSAMEADQAARERMVKPQRLQAGAGTGAFARALDDDESLPARFVVSDLTFLPDSAQIEAASAAVLDDVARALSAHPTARVRVEGHTDNTGELEKSRKLSQERAESARGYLLTKGVGGDRVTSAGFGPDSPIATNDTAEGRAENRRIELVLLQR
jgi:outer membrane protein OmpA-like peptidoglycan-associated protein